MTIAQSMHSPYRKCSFLFPTGPRNPHTKIMLGIYAGTLSKSHDSLEKASQSKVRRLPGYENWGPCPFCPCSSYPPEQLLNLGARGTFVAHNVCLPTLKLGLPPKSFKAHHTKCLFSITISWSSPWGTVVFFANFLLPCTVPTPVGLVPGFWDSVALLCKAFAFLFFFFFFMLTIIPEHSWLSCYILMATSCAL